MEVQRESGIVKYATTVTVYSKDGKKIEEYRLDKYFDEEMLKALDLEEE